MISLTDKLDHAVDPKRARILVGAMKVFLAYGFQRTTMDDIARAAEISRPALYLLFKNKTDIYRALASEFLEQALAGTKTVLAEDGPIEERLGRATGCLMDLLQEVEEAPHGEELLDMQNSLANDLIVSCRTRMAALFEEAMSREMAATHVDLDTGGISSAGLADMLLDSLDGMKLRRLALDDQRRLRAEYIRVISTILAR